MFESRRMKRMNREGLSRNRATKPFMEMRPRGGPATLRKSHQALDFITESGKRAPQKMLGAYGGCGVDVRMQILYALA